MKKHDIIKFALDADLLDARDDLTNPIHVELISYLERFANLVAKHEREKLPDTFGVMFAVERAVDNGHAPWDIVSAFEEYEEARKARSQS